MVQQSNSQAEALKPQETVTLHDFKPVNRYIDWETDRLNQILDDRRAGIWERWGGVFIRFCVGIALLMIAAGILYWFLEGHQGFIRQYHFGNQSLTQMSQELEQELAQAQGQLNTMAPDDPTRTAVEARIAALEAQLTAIADRIRETGGPQTAAALPGQSALTGGLPNSGSGGFVGSGAMHPSGADAVTGSARAQGEAQNNSGHVGTKRLEPEGTLISRPDRELKPTFASGNASSAAAPLGGQPAATEGEYSGSGLPASAATVKTPSAQPHGPTGTSGDTPTLSEQDAIIKILRDELTANNAPSDQDEPALSTEEEQQLLDTMVTIFKRVDVPDVGRVITGRRFLPRDIDNPISQYCYLETQGVGGPEAQVTLLAKITEDGEFRYMVRPGTKEHNLARRHCRFRAV